MIRSSKRNWIEHDCTNEMGVHLTYHIRNSKSRRSNLYSWILLKTPHVISPYREKKLKNIHFCGRHRKRKREIYYNVTLWRIVITRLKERSSFPFQSLGYRCGNKEYLQCLWRTCALSRIPWCMPGSREEWEKMLRKLWSDRHSIW